MGVSFSFDGASQLDAEPEERYIVVPPLLEADLLRDEADRFSSSGFEWCSGLPALRMLQSKHLQSGAQCSVNLAPSPDMRLHASSKFDKLQWENVGRGNEKYIPSSAVMIRQSASRYSFARIQYSQRKGSKQFPWFAACVCGPDCKWATYAHLPLQKDMREMSINHAYGGFRIGSSLASAGVEASARGAERAWSLVKLQNLNGAHTNLLLGAQFEFSGLGARYARHTSMGWVSDLVKGVSSRASAFGQYSLGPPSSNTTIHVGLDEGNLLKLAAFHHISRVRRVYNLFEDDDVVGVCNYLDFGVHVVAPLEAESSEHASFEAAGSWQVNSNLMVKAAACTARVMASVVLKSWWNPRFTGSLAAGWDFKTGHPCLGCHIIVDNDDAVLPHYERGFQSTRTGSLVRELHKATNAEVAAADGTRLIVPDRSSAAESVSAEILEPSGGSSPSKYSERYSDVL